MPSQHLESTKIKPAARVAWTSLMISLKLWKKEGGRFWHSWKSSAWGWLFPRKEAESFSDIFIPWIECPYGKVGDRLWGQEAIIHMPRWASRILLEVAEIRVERLLDITPNGGTDGRHGMLSGTMKKPMSGLWRGDTEKSAGLAFARLSFFPLWEKWRGAVPPNWIRGCGLFSSMY